MPLFNKWYWETRYPQAKVRSYLTPPTKMNSRRRKNWCKKSSWRKLKSLRRSVCGRLWVSSALGNISNCVWQFQPGSVISLSVLSCFIGAHRQNAQGVSSECRWETSSGQKAYRYRVQIRWQLAAKWRGMGTHPFWALLSTVRQKSCQLNVADLFL